MSKEAQPGWAPTPHKSRRKNKSKGRNNLLNALAHAKDRHAEGVERATRFLLRDRAWWEGLSEEERKPYLDGSIKRFGPPCPPPDPASPEGQAYIARYYAVRPWAAKIAKLERQLERL